MRVNHAWDAFATSSSSRPRRWLGLLILACALLGACHFDAQPLFEADTLGESSLGDGDGDGEAGAPREGDASDLDAGRETETHTGIAAQDTTDAAAPSDASADGPSEDGAASQPARDASSLQCDRDKAGRALGCDGDALVVCNRSGAAEREACGAAGCNAAARRCNECVPRTTSCSGGQLVSCDASGRIAERRECALGCAASAQGEASCGVCEPGAAMCEDGEQTRCAADGLSREQTACARGCDEEVGLCVGSLVPSNLPPEACQWQDVGEREVRGDETIEVDKGCSLLIPQDNGAPDLCVLSFERLRIAKEGVLRLVGSRAVALVATDSMEIEGRVTVSADGPAPGPGSLRAGEGVGGTALGRVADTSEDGEWTNLPANAGGGGGGHRTVGASGGAAPGACDTAVGCAEPGAGGQVHGIESLVPLVGGALGGRNSAAEWSSRRGDPGGGGGALQLVACGELSLGAQAIVDANGGGGDGGQPGSSEMDSDTPGGGAGGGSGGAILVQAFKLRAQAGATLVANGGGGGGGATRSAEAEEPRIAGEPGEDGTLSDRPAAGGAGAGDSLPGGAGGSTGLPGPGEPAALRRQGAGGGGGAAGRIRLETPRGAPVPAGMVVSPAPTYGTVVAE